MDGDLSATVTAVAETAGMSKDEALAWFDQEVRPFVVLDPNVQWVARNDGEIVGIRIPHEVVELEKIAPGAIKGYADSVANPEVPVATLEEVLAAIDAQ